MTQDEQKTAALSFRMAQSVKDALEELAKAEHRTLSNYVAHVLADHVKTCRGDKASGTRKVSR
jgi:hypothetical protein